MIFDTDGHHGNFTCVGIVHHWYKEIFDYVLESEKEKVRNTLRGYIGGHFFNVPS